MMVNYEKATTSFWNSIRINSFSSYTFSYYFQNEYPYFNYKCDNAVATVG